MKDIMKSNKWNHFKKRMYLKGREEKELVDWIELLEGQIITLEMMLHRLKETKDGNDQQREEG